MRPKSFGSLILTVHLLLLLCNAELSGGSQRSTLSYDQYRQPSLPPHYNGTGIECGTGEDFYGSFVRRGEIEKESWPQKRALQPCFKKKYFKRFNETLNSLRITFTQDDNTGSVNSCGDLIERYGQMKQVKIKGLDLWYPRMPCRSKKSNYFKECGNSLQNLETKILNTRNFTNCRGNTNCLRYIFMPFFPWNCQKSCDNEKIDLLVQLSLVNETLPNSCGDTVCSVTRKLQNVYFLSVNELADPDQICKKTLYEIDSSPYCSTRKSAFCFHAIKGTHIRESVIAFISTDTETISENEKMVLIFRTFTNFEGSGWCNRPLNDTIEERQSKSTYFFCDSSSNNNSSDIWVIKEVTEKIFLVALNAKVSVDTIKDNAILQGLLFNKTRINSTIYDNLKQFYLNSTLIIGKIPFFATKSTVTASSVLDNIMQTDQSITITKTEYFTRLRHNESVESLFNFLIFHNCSHYFMKDSKSLLLFLYDDSLDLDLEYICHHNTAVMLTKVSVNEEDHVVLIDWKSYDEIVIPFPKEILNELNEECHAIVQEMLQYKKFDGSYFYHFLVYPKKLKKHAALNLLSKKMKNLKKMKCLHQTFPHKWGTKKLVVTVTTISHTDVDSSQLDESGNDLCTESIQSNLKTFVHARLTSRNKCTKALEEDRFSVDMNCNIMKNDSRILPEIVFGPVPYDMQDVTCAASIPKESFDIIENFSKRNLSTVNKFWPTHMHNKVIVWSNTSQLTTVILDWDYLPPKYKALELSLFILCWAITLITICGNITVIIILIFSKLVKKSIYKIYFSVALADLLIGVTLAPLALCDTYNLINGKLTIRDFIRIDTFHLFRYLDLFPSLLTMNNIQPPGFQQIRFRRHGWPAFCAIAMNISVLSSLLSLALLGVERLLMFLSILLARGKYNIGDCQNNMVNADHQVDSQSNEKIRLNGVQNKEDCTNENSIQLNEEDGDTFEICRNEAYHDNEKNSLNNVQEKKKTDKSKIKFCPKRLMPQTDNNTRIWISILIIWIWNIVSSIIINIGTDEKETTFTGFFDPITKLTLNMGKGTSSLSITFFYLQVIIASIAGIIIVIATILSIIVFKVLRSEREKTGMRIHHLKKEEEAHSVTRTFVMMVVLFLISCAPVAISILVNISTKTDLSVTYPVVHFLIWWLFIAGSSWNWVIYSYRGKQFRDEAKKLRLRFWSC